MSNDRFRRFQEHVFLLPKIPGDWNQHRWWQWPEHRGRASVDLLGESDVGDRWDVLPSESAGTASFDVSKSQRFNGNVIHSSSALSNCDTDISTYGPEGYSSLQEHDVAEVWGWKQMCCLTIATYFPFFRRVIASFSPSFASTTQTRLSCTDKAVNLCHCNSPFHLASVRKCVGSSSNLPALKVSYHS